MPDYFLFFKIENPSLEISKLDTTDFKSFYEFFLSIIAATPNETTVAMIYIIKISPSVNTLALPSVIINLVYPK